MAELSWPTSYYTLSSADQWRQLASNFASDGVDRGIGSELSVFGDSSGMRVSVNTGGAIVAGTAYNTSALTYLAIANGNAYPRIDRVMLRYTFSGGLITLAIRQGVPNASPVPPVPVRDASMQEISLAQVYVAASLTTFITAGNVTDERCWSSGRAPTLYTVGGGGASVLTSWPITYFTVPAQGFPYRITASGTLLLDISDTATNFEVLLREGGAGVHGTAVAWGGAARIDSIQVRNGGGSAKLSAYLTVADGLQRAICLYVNRTAGAGTGATYIDAPSNRLDLIVEPL